MTWGALNARARGLETHLLRRSGLEALARAPDLGALALELQRLGYLAPEDVAVSPAALDLAVRRQAAALLRRLALWCTGQPDITTIIFEDEDRRSLRAMVRGALAQVPADARLAGLIPTPALPERALAALAHQPTPAAVAALLVAWGNPYGAALRDVASVSEPDALQLELQLGRAFARRALAAGKRSGRALLAYVRQAVDIENAFSALALADNASDVVPKDLFLEGGDRVTLEVFEQALATGQVVSAAAALGRVFGPSDLGRVFEQYGGDPARIEGEVLRARIAQLRRDARLDPLGPAPLLGFALRLRAQNVDLRRAVWGVALGAPRGTLSAVTVTA